MILEFITDSAAAPMQKLVRGTCNLLQSCSCHAGRVDIRFAPYTQIRCNLKRWVVSLGNWKTDTRGDENAGYSALVTAKMYILANQ